MNLHSIDSFGASVASAQRKQDTMNSRSQAEDGPRAISIFAQQPCVWPATESLILKSPKTHTHIGDDSGMLGSGGLSTAEGSHGLAEVTIEALVQRESDSGTSNPSQHLGSCHAKEASQMTLHSVLARHPRDIGAVPFNSGLVSSSPAVYMPKILPADLWYRAYCPERKHHVRPLPVVLTLQAEGVDLDFPALCVASSPNSEPSVIFSSTKANSKLVQSSTVSKETLPATKRRAAKRAAKRITQRACRDSDFLPVTTPDNNSGLPKVLTDARTVRATARAANKTDIATDGDSGQIVVTEVENSCKRNLNQALDPFQPTESFKAADAVDDLTLAQDNLGPLRAISNPIVATAERKSARIAGKNTQEILDQASSLASLPTKSLKRKQCHQPPDDKYTDLPFRTLHNLLKMIQMNVEEAIFFFVKKWCPEYLRQRGWEVPEQGELTKASWWNALVQIRVPNHAVDFAHIDVEVLYNRIAQIRHAAVHRLEVSNLRLREQMIPDAISFLHGLKDIPRKNKIREIQWIFTRELDNKLDLQALQQFLGMEPEPANSQISTLPMSRSVQIEPPRKRTWIEEPARKHVEYIIIDDEDDEDPTRECLDYIDLTQDTDDDIDDEDQ